MESLRALSAKALASSGVKPVVRTMTPRTPRRPAGLEGLPHPFLGHGDHRQVHGAGNALQAGVGQQGPHRPPLLADGLVDGEDRSLEAAENEVFHHPVADALRVAAGPHHGHPLGEEEGVEAGDGGDLLPPLKALRRFLRQDDLKLHLHLAPLPVGLDLEAAFHEDVQHGPVFRQGKGLEAPHAPLGGDEGEPFQKQGAQALALVGVVHQKGHLGGVLALDPHVLPRGHDPLGLPGQDDEGHLLLLGLGREEELRRLLRGDGGEEAHAQGLGGEAPQEVYEEGKVLLAGPPQEGGAPVLEEDGALLEAVLGGGGWDVAHTPILQQSGGFRAPAPPPA